MVYEMMSWNHKKIQTESSDDDNIVTNIRKNTLLELMKKTIGFKIFLEKVVDLEKAFKFREKRKLGLFENDVLLKTMHCQHQT